jgi:predicted amidohydrolase/ribosomal protein S18 acetylase RimI-like enzyme
MSASKSNVTVRQATAADIPSLIDLNRIAYPTLAEDNIVWARSHLESHQRIFPQGQLVAELDGKVVGAVATLIVDMGPNPLRDHTWSGVTDSGYFTNHNPHGDTLYGADVYVHPKTRGKGVGAALYEGRRQLCKQLNLRRILLGGRLWNYSEHANQMSAHEYAARVAADELHDLVLSFQLHQGFSLRAVMPHYLKDANSHNYASLLEWLNPDYQPRGRNERKVRVACVQYQMRKVEGFDDFAKMVAYFVDIAADYGCDFVMFPELYTIQLLSAVDALSPREGIRQVAEYFDDVVKLSTDLAMKHGITIIAGSTPQIQGDKVYNVTPVCLPNGSVALQPKLHVTPNERRWWGISGGRRLAVIDTPVARIGVQICYDIEFPEAARHLADAGAEIIFVPFCTDNRQGYLRVRYCAQARAIENQIYVALAGNVGNLPDVENMDINYGQAAVLTPSDFAFARDGIKAEADSNEETLLICDLDLDDLSEAVHGGSVNPRLDRRVDLFRLTVHVEGDMPTATDQPLGDLPGDNK